MTYQPDEWIAVEQVREALADLRRRLKAGASGQGVTLDADDCVKLLAALVDPAYPNSRPPDYDALMVDATIYADVCLRQRGMPRAQAVAETAKLFGCDKQHVNKVIRTRERDGLTVGLTITRE